MKTKNNDKQENDKILTKKPKEKRKNPFFDVNQKENKDKRREKRARIIVRNISYKAKEETIRKHFEQYGKILDINILKRGDGKLVGCAFLQFETVNQAAKSILKGTNSLYLGRPVYVDWAVGKDEYEKRKNVKDEVKIEDDKQNDTKSVKEESEYDEKEDLTDGNEAEDDSEMSEEMNSNFENDSSSDEDNKFDVNEDSKCKIKDELKIENSKILSNDVQEGCTIFLKNVPFDASNDDLRKVCRKYGPVYYTIINTNPISGHSRGTAFVKFKTKESADMCLRAGEEFNLMNTVLESYPALSREEVRDKNSSKDKEHKDSRNLYLAKEGLIMTGSKAAEDVSAADITKRHKLEQVKTQVLKNLNRFVSRNRLSIHNLPSNYDDEKLKELIMKHTNFKPHECRVMRDNKPSTGNPKGKSKGFGFMSFKTHQDALSALRKLNNNPNIFGNQNRPIVGFSIEDRSVHNIKEKRLQKSLQNNPTYKEKLDKKKLKQKSKTSKDNKFEVQKKITNFSSGNKRTKVKSVDHGKEGNYNEFVGMPAKPGSFVRMRSVKKIREQAIEHKKNLGETKRKQKKRKEKILHRIEKKSIDRTKMGKKKSERDNFSVLVDKYKKIIDSNAKVQMKKPKRSKWYIE